ncbi:MAG TPA: hypothetical protein PKE21_15350 [Flavobacteriales bacterium]|nr:hypothetical protein [Flavobacteriales bacterium]HMR28857.1 hypothetical protein [Flavobacteriales bacterium]
MGPPATNSCGDLPATFESYEQALRMVRSADFMIAEHQDTDGSSWVRGAEFYSCDGESGYFILTTEQGSYIHRGVPLAVWNGSRARHPSVRTTTNS